LRALQGGCAVSVGGGVGSAGQPGPRHAGDGAATGADDNERRCGAGAGAGGVRADLGRRDCAGGGPAAAAPPATGDVCADSEAAAGRGRAAATAAGGAVRRCPQKVRGVRGYAGDQCGATNWATAPFPLPRRVCSHKKHERAKAKRKAQASEGAGTGSTTSPVSEVAEDGVSTDDAWAAAEPIGMAHLSLDDRRAPNAWPTVRPTTASAHVPAPAPASAPAFQAPPPRPRPPVAAADPSRAYVLPTTTTTTTTTIAAATAAAAPTWAYQPAAAPATTAAYRYAAPAPAPAPAPAAAAVPPPYRPPTAVAAPVMAAAPQTHMAGRPSPRPVASPAQRIAQLELRLQHILQLEKDAQAGTPLSIEEMQELVRKDQVARELTDLVQFTARHAFAAAAPAPPPGALNGVRYT